MAKGPITELPICSKAKFNQNIIYYFYLTYAILLLTFVITVVDPQPLVHLDLTIT